MSKRNRLATYAMGIAIATTMAGCGGDDGDGGEGGGDSGFADGSAADIVKAAQEAMGELTSVHIAGDITTDGTTTTMDYSLSTDGNCTGTIALDGAGFEVLQVDGEAWFKADAAFWEAQAPDQAAQIIEMTGDKWVVDSEKAYTAFCDLEAFLEELVSDDEKEFEKDGTEDVDGAEAVKIVGEDSDAFIAADEPHYILLLRGTDEGDEGEVTFSEFDEEIEVEAPSADEVVDLEQ